MGDSLYNSMLEQNLCRIIEPYSKVQVDYVASKIGLPKTEVEKKLSQMILDKKFQGILDQETGVLIIFTKESRDKTFDDDRDSVGHERCGGSPVPSREEAHLIRPSNCELYVNMISALVTTNQH